jgi:hypothetical protein
MAVVATMVSKKTIAVRKNDPLDFIVAQGFGVKTLTGLDKACLSLQFIGMRRHD